MEEQKMAKSMQENSPVGEFLQSEVWQKFQESVGRKTFHVDGENFWANIIEHKLPIAGKYFYVPRGPIFKNKNDNEKLKNDFDELVKLAKENKIGWIRIEPEREEILEMIKNAVGADLVSAREKQTQIEQAQTEQTWEGQTQGLSLRKYKIIKSPHDVQPREIFVIDISKSEEELLAEMKPKTRYNIRLAEKKDIKIFNIGDDKYVEEFLRLTAVMAKRQGIVAHPENYYRKMFEVIPGDILKLYVAEYENKVIAANLVVFYGDTCIYLHGASDDEYRNVMAPYLLQWRQICDAKKAGCVRYDFGGVKNPPHPNPLLTKERGQNAGKSPSPYQGEGGRRPDEVNPWSGITKFKTGFSPETVPTIFPGSYDIILDNKKYWAYKFLQKLKNIF